MSEAVKTRRDGGVLEVTLDRPKANAIDYATSRAMGEVFQSFRDDPDLRVAIVTGAGEKFFSAGWDLKAAAAGDPVDGWYGVGGFGGIQELRDLNKPVIAAVNGMAVGGGFELALSADLILAAEHARFALPEIRAGTLADAATAKLPKRMPYHVAMDLLLTGRWMDAAEAHRWGARQRSASGRQASRPRLGAGAHARRRSAARLRRDQGGRARGRGRKLSVDHEQDRPPAISDGRYSLRQRGSEGGSTSLR